MNDANAANARETRQSRSGTDGRSVLPNVVTPEEDSPAGWPQTPALAWSRLRRYQGRCE